MSAFRFAHFLFWCFNISKCIAYNGPIAGNKTVSECINGQKWFNSDLEITTSEMIRKEGYPAEEHLISTEDGYLLTLHRIPGPSGSPAVFLQHGLILSSFDYVVNGKDEALAFLLADKGYDVWLGNLRGTLYSQCHIMYTTSDRDYWNFSFHEMGIYDLPAQITYVTDMKKDDLIYVGHSMGTTSFFIMAIERPDIASKVKAMFGLAPVAFNYYMKGLVMLFSAYGYTSDIYSQIANAGQSLSQSLFHKLMVKYMCAPLSITRKLCVDILLFPVTGFDAAQFNYTLMPLYFNHYPSGASSKTFDHYSQSALTGKFRQFDYGKKGNLRMYNSSEPPEYDLSKMQVPIGVFISDNDYLADPTDAEHLYRLIPKKIMNYRVKDPKFNHFDFLWAVDARDLVYSKLLSVMDPYR